MPISENKKASNARYTEERMEREAQKGGTADE